MSLAMLEAAMDTARANLELVKRGGAPAGDAPSRFGGVSTGTAGTVGGLPVSAFERNERIKTLESQMDSYDVEWHKKFAIPFACIIFVLIGAPIAVRFPRGGAGMVIAISLLIFGIYYVSLIGGESLGDKGTIPPFLGPWAPNMFFGAIGLLAAMRIGRETSTTRGGGWDDMRSSIIGLFTRPFRKRA
jgi:lipopolysaccharide export system permease protein